MKKPTNFGPGQTPSLIGQGSGSSVQLGIKIPKPAIDPYRGGYKGGNNPVKDPADKKN